MRRGRGRGVLLWVLAVSVVVNGLVGFAPLEKLGVPEGLAPGVESAAAHECPPGDAGCNAQHPHRSGGVPAGVRLYCLGDYSLSGGRCVKAEWKTAPYRLRCPSGVFRGGLCHYSVTETAPRPRVPGALGCPRGGSLSGGSCVVRYTRSWVPTVYGACRFGGRAVGSRCVYTKAARWEGPPRWGGYVCDAGWALSGSTCRRSVARPVTKRGYWPACRAGYSGVGRACTGTYRAVRGVSVPGACDAGWRAASASRCERTVQRSRPAQRAYYCTAGWDLEVTRCTRTLQRDPARIYYCDSGYNRVGTRCYKQTAPPRPPRPPPPGPRISGLAVSGAVAAGGTYSDSFTVTGAAASVTGGGCSRSPGRRSGDAVAYTLTVTRADAGIRECTVTAGSASQKVTVTFTGDPEPEPTTTTPDPEPEPTTTTPDPDPDPEPEPTTTTTTTTTTTAPPERVQIVGFAGGSRTGPGTMTATFTVAPADATCRALLLGRTANRASISPRTGSRRTVTVTAAAIDDINVYVSCAHATLKPSTKRAVFTVRPACELPITADGNPVPGTWTTACTSSQRGNAQTPYYAKRYTFTLAAAAAVTVDLSSQQTDAYLILLSGHGADGAVVASNDNAAGDTRDARLSVDLAAGDYTIEATTSRARSTGGFTLTATAAAAPAPAACPTTDLGVLGLDEVISGGVWSASGGCVSSQRGSTGSPHYARYFTFTLKAGYSNVTVDLESSQNTYLYLLSGHGVGGRVLADDGDADDTTPNTQVSVNLSAGKYTIEATTFEPGVEGGFTLIAVDPPADSDVVGEPLSRKFKLVGPWSSPWTHANVPHLESVTSLESVTPSPKLSLEVTYRHDTAPDSITVTYSGTPTHAGSYEANFAYLSGDPRKRLTQKIEVLCPTGTTRQPDLTCLHDFVVADVPHGRTRYPVTFAALKGMTQAADEWVGKFQLDSSCGVIPEQYRLTRNMLVAILVAIQRNELTHDDQPNSLMVLSRGDRYFFPLPKGEEPKPGNRKVNKVLYSLNNPSNYERAFWHPGVGLYQLDDANLLFGSRLNHAERAHAKTSASTALEIFHRNYCERSSGFSNRQQAIDRLQNSLYPTWYGCEHPACLSTLDDLVEGKGSVEVKGGRFFSDAELAEDRRLHLNSFPLVHENGGGVDPRTCRWSTSSDGTFTCFIYDISKAEGYVRLSDYPSGTKGRSPLALPFLSFTGYLPNFNPTSNSMECDENKNSDWKHLKKFVVFRHEETGYTKTEDVNGKRVERDVDLIAAVPCGKNIRKSFTGTGWWHMNEIDGASLVVVG